MSALPFPCTLFKSQKRMDHYTANDMRCGDLSETELKRHFNLTDVSAKVDPYTLTEITPFRQPQSMFYGSRDAGKKLSREQCARLLFDEFRQLSRPFAIYGPYRHLIEKMITHMQNCNGMPFRDIYLNAALKKRILNDRTKDSSLSKIKIALTKFVDWENGYYPVNKKDEFDTLIRSSYLPKFAKFQDSFNGMGITVHDTYATHITIKSLQIEKDGYRAIIHYQVQDHFGLDNEDILKFKFYQFRFFRIWFVLQRYHQLAFKPFMTNMEATLEIVGNRNEKI
ncbi:uncharacterized protein (TIGR03034 family) [Erwinia toletana]|uniref:Uncharacterized protein (TIGR03034 family) n=1 Tax=Winslowiella toletana TaxID=92490 RepID=A0ABS4P8J6_9GAMM|nr:YPO3983 family protein [Winslowiella toletana]MBP2168963.1 uncharacterized protein (TIGR03034 family) [Winslowiella toletana]